MGTEVGTGLDISLSVSGEMTTEAVCLIGWPLKSHSVIGSISAFFIQHSISYLCSNSRYLTFDQAPPHAIHFPYFY